MATKITQQDSMYEAATKIAGGFTEFGATPPSITEQDSMSDIARKVNNAFDAIVDSPQYIIEQDAMQVIANKIDGNFAAADETPIEPPTPEIQSFSFLHASDPHCFSFDLLKTTLNADSDCEFAMVTGDFKKYLDNGPLDSYYNASTLNNSSNYNGKLLACAGNHDAWDTWDNKATNRDNRWMSKWLYTLMGNSVNWGDTLGAGFDGAPISSYYYKDFNTNGSHPVRLITIDQFEVYKKLGINGNTYNANYHSVVVMTNKQMQWFVQLLKDTPANYTIIIALHETPFYNNSGYIQSLDPYADGITAQQQIERLFMSETIYAPTYSEQNDNRYHKTSGEVETCGLIVNIMKAYLSKSSWVATYSDSNFPADGTTLSVNADFTNMGHEPAAFACYIFGHIHNDNHYWVKMSDAPKQLMLSICRAHKNVNSSYDDLVTTTPPDQRINKVTIEFAHGNTPMCVHIERIGQQTTKKERTRDELFFYFDDNQTISHERITNWEQSV